MPKQKKNTKHSRPVVKFHMLGIDKLGMPITKPEPPRMRLSQIEVDYLKLFYSDNTPRPTTDLLVEYSAKYEKPTSIAIASAVLSNLKKGGFLQATKGKVRKVNRIENQLATIVKTKYSFSDAAKTGKLRFDAQRWVIERDVYRCDETTRARVERNEARRLTRQQSLRFCNLPREPMVTALLVAPRSKK